MDWRALLIKYMAHVCAEEGITFLGPSHVGSDAAPFSREELAALREVEQEASTPCDDGEGT